MILIYLNKLKFEERPDYSWIIEKLEGGKAEE
jgi:hypothetical protein